MNMLPDVRTYREREGLSQQALAERLGVTQSMVARLELSPDNKNYRPASPQLAQKLAELFRAPPAAFQPRRRATDSWPRAARGRRAVMTPLDLNEIVYRLNATRRERIISFILEMAMEEHPSNGTDDDPVMTKDDEKITE
jgi:transcriptional regulator with XRE-family HTH domain